MTEPKVAKKSSKKSAKKKKKQQKRLTPFMKLVCFGFLGFSAFLLFETIKEVYTTVELKNQLAEAEEKYQTVVDENVYLTTERDKLTDPEYVQTYARGNYMLSKDGEQIFYLPEKED